MHRQRVGSAIGQIFKEASYHDTSKRKTKIYGYLELNNGVLEISKFKNAGKLNMELRVVLNGQLKPNLRKIVSSYSEIRNYVKELNYEDMSALQNLLIEVS